jgi:hypothetical protein
MSDTAQINLFSYGTLQLDSVQLSSFGRLLVGTKDAIPGFSRSMVEITDPDVIRTSGSNFHPIVGPSENPADQVEEPYFILPRKNLQRPMHTRFQTTNELKSA